MTGQSQQMFDTIESDQKTRTLALLIRAAHATVTAAQTVGFAPGKRRDLLTQYRDQCKEIGRYTGHSQKDIEYFLEGQEERVAKVIARRVGAGVVNPLGYQIGDQP